MYSKCTLKNKKQNNFKFFFVGVLKVTDEKSRIFISYLEVGIRGSGSVRIRNTLC